ncbi:MAG: hypothetical protein VYC70_06675 [Verrucomicrobiota bacterium]|nr:hypothetical protein [Verrucomicrobiota bacterium]
MSYKIVKTLLVVTCLNLCGQAFVYSQEDEKEKKPFGFVSRMPQDTEVIYGLRHLEQFTQEIGKTNTWEKLIELFELESGFDLSEVAEPWGSAMDFVGEDAFFGFGNGTAERLEKLNEINDAYNKISLKVAGSQMLSALGLGGDDEPDPEEFMRDLLQELLSADEGKNAKLMQELQLPSFIAGAKVGKGMSAQLVNQLSALEADLPPFVLTSEFKVLEDQKFRSWSVAAKDVFDDSAREQMREAIGDEDLAAKLEKIIDTKKIELSFGSIDEYVILGIGPDHKHIKFAKSEEDSLLAVSDFEFAKGYGEKKILAYNYLSKSALTAFYAKDSFKAMSDSIVKLIESMKEGGIDLTKAVPLMKNFGNQITKIVDISIDSTAGVLYRENGLKWASVGGYSVAGMDSNSSLKLAPNVPKDAFFLLNAVEDPKYRASGIEITETIAELLHVIGSSAVKIQGDENAGQIFAMFDQMLTPKILKVWGIMKNKVANGLGSEGGIVVDLKGSMPKVPGFPAEFIKNGKLPRVAVYNSVKNRKLLSEAWDELVPVINEIAAAVPGQEPGQEFQLPDSLSSEGKNVTTHFMGLPFVSNDFLPSLSISDEMFFLSTSKKFTEDLAASIVKPNEEKITGLVMKVRFDSLTQFAGDWLTLVEENNEVVDVGDDFIEIANSVRKALSFTAGIKVFDYRRYKENRWRTDWHFEVKDIK